VTNYNPSLVPAGKCLANVKHVRAWKKGSACVWRSHGVWDVVDGQSVLLKQDYFRWRNEAGVRVPVNLSCDYFVPFAIRFKLAIDKAIEGRGCHPLLIFLDPTTDFEDVSIGSWPTCEFSLPMQSFCLLRTPTYPKLLFVSLLKNTERVCVSPQRASWVRTETLQRDSCGLHIGTISFLS